MAARAFLSGDPESAFTAFREAWQAECQSPQSTRLNPYPGLRSFNLDERPIFKARERQIEALEQAVALPQNDRNSARHVVMVIGGSSSGKSSIVKAGLLSGIQSLEMPGRPGSWYIAECRPVKSPMQEILRGLARMLIDTIVREWDALRKQRAAEPKARAKRLEEALELVVPGCPAPGDTWESPAYFAAVDYAKDKLSARLWGPAQQEAARQSLRALPVAADADSELIVAFSRFVHVTLDEFDRILFPGRLDDLDQPRLLLSIDQFEEIFRSDEITIGSTAFTHDNITLEKQAVFELIRAADKADRGLGDRAGPMGDGDSSKFLIVISMRSEEAHRCSQERELADVFNRAVHLVQLVMRDDARAAIVEPAQLTLIRLGFRYNLDQAFPFTEAAVQQILDAYEQASATVEHRADALSLLQHFLRLLWQISVDRWLDGPPKQPLVIDPAALSAVDGWNSKQSADVPKGDTEDGQHPLARVLNRRAASVLTAAISAWTQSQAAAMPVDLPDEEIIKRAVSVLQAALVSLVRFDDNRRVVRDWRTLDDMLDASKVAEQFRRRLIADHPEIDVEMEIERQFRAPLRAALAEFEKATLIERRLDAGTRAGAAHEDRYAVYHESLIRNWTDYDGWVRETAKAVAALRSIVEETRAHQSTATRQPEEVITIGREADLRAIMGPVENLPAHLAATLQINEANERRSRQNRPWASDAWADAEIARTVGTNLASPFDLAALQALRSGALVARYEQLTRQEREAKERAQREKKESQNRLRLISMTLIAMTGFAIIIGALLIVNKIDRNTYIAAKLSRIGSEASTYIIGRLLRHDLDSWLVMEGLNKNTITNWEQFGGNRQLREERDIALESTKFNLRSALADAVFTLSNPFKTNAETIPVKCFGAGSPEIEVTFFNNSKNRPLYTPDKIDYKINDGKLLYYHYDRSKIDYPVYNVPHLDKMAKVCASTDGSALILLAELNGKRVIYMALTHWNRWKAGDSKWYWSLASQPRFIRTKLADDRLSRYLVHDLTEESVSLVRSGSLLGFRLLVSDALQSPPDGRTHQAPAYLWTNEGFSTTVPVEVSPDHKFKPVECKADDIALKCSVTAMVPGRSDNALSFEASYLRPRIWESNKNSTECFDSQQKVANPEFCLVSLKMNIYNIQMIMTNYIGRPPVGIRVDSDAVYFLGDDDIVRKLSISTEVSQEILQHRLDSFLLNDKDQCKEIVRNPISDNIPRFYEQNMPDALAVCRQRVTITGQGKKE